MRTEAWFVICVIGTIAVYMLTHLAIVAAICLFLSGLVGWPLLDPFRRVRGRPRGGLAVDDDGGYKYLIPTGWTPLDLALEPGFDTTVPSEHPYHRDPLEYARRSVRAGVLWGMPQTWNEAPYVRTRIMRTASPNIAVVTTANSNSPPKVHRQINFG